MPYDVVGRSQNYVWDPNTLQWVVETQPSGGSGGTVNQGTAGSDPWLVKIFKTDLTPSAPTAASVGITSAQAVAANANRKGLILVNTSVNRISLGFGQTAVLDSGVTLYPAGSYSMGDYDFDLGAVNAIASGASSNLTIQEYAT